ncbi:MAG: molybdopterin molybdenumtransferase MoeA, partial [Desulfosporosinus sp.]
MNQNNDLSVTRAEALALLLENWPLKAGTELIPIQQALGRVTAKNVYSQNTMPVCDVSQADGIAVRSADFSNGLPDTSSWLKGVEFVQADTGDDFPNTFDTIIPVESIYYDNDGKLHFSDGFRFVKGDRVRKAGSMVKEGDLLVEAHIRLTPLHLAVLGLGGIYQLEVIKKPKVVYMPTGSELITGGIKPQRGQNVESNGLMVSAFLQQWGAEPICYPIIKDKP